MKFLVKMWFDLTPRTPSKSAPAITKYSDISSLLSAYVIRLNIQTSLYHLIVLPIFTKNIQTYANALNILILCTLKVHHSRIRPLRY